MPDSQQKIIWNPISLKFFSIVGVLGLLSSLKDYFSYSDLLVKIIYNFDKFSELLWKKFGDIFSINIIKYHQFLTFLSVFLLQYAMFLFKNEKNSIIKYSHFYFILESISFSIFFYYLFIGFAISDNIAGQFIVLVIVSLLVFLTLIQENNDLKKSSRYEFLFIIILFVIFLFIVAIYNYYYYAKFGLHNFPDYVLFGGFFPVLVRYFYRSTSFSSLVFSKILFVSIAIIFIDVIFVWFLELLNAFSDLEFQ